MCTLLLQVRPMLARSLATAIPCTQQIEQGQSGKPERLRCAAGYLAHGTATDYMYDRLNVPLSLTWEIYGDTEATFNDCFRMFNPTTRERFEEVRLCHTEWD